MYRQQPSRWWKLLSERLVFLRKGVEMLITYTCTGGIANLALEYRADTAELPQETAEKLKMLVDRAQLLNREWEEKQQVGTQRAADAFSYQVSVEHEGQKKAFQFTDVTAPDEVRPLLDQLRNLAIEQKMKGYS
jgi:hypothetical protein